MAFQDWLELFKVDGLLVQESLHPSKIFQTAKLYGVGNNILGFQDSSPDRSFSSGLELYFGGMFESFLIKLRGYGQELYWPAFDIDPDIFSFGVSQLCQRGFDGTQKYQSRPTHLESADGDQDIEVFRQHGFDIVQGSNRACNGVLLDNALSGKFGDDFDGLPQSHRGLAYSLRSQNQRLAQGGGAEGGAAAGAVQEHG
jgi:hypothetical protein